MKNKAQIAYKEFSKALQSFFEDYIIKERGYSRNTIKSYSETFSLLLIFLKETKGIACDHVGFEVLDRTCISEFLSWLEKSRGSQPQTRNQRNAAIKSFFKYMIYYDPIHISRWQEICSIRFKKVATNTIKYLSVEGVCLLLNQIPRDTRRGKRDLALLSLLYYGGLRVQEVIDLMPCSIRFEKPYMVEVIGKGAKKRFVYLNEMVIDSLSVYMKQYQLQTVEKVQHPLFFNSRGEKLTNAGITYILQKYAISANKISPELVECKPTPHWLRHSRAEHLLQKGYPIVAIRDMLGHASIQTTEIYARINDKIKEEALIQLSETINPKSNKKGNWETNEKLKSYLRGLIK